MSPTFVTKVPEAGDWVRIQHTCCVDRRTPGKWVDHDEPVEVHRVVKMTYPVGSYRVETRRCDGTRMHFLTDEDAYEIVPAPEGEGDCTCVFSCADDPATACSLSGRWHVHPNRWKGDVFGACPQHPDAPGDL